MKHRRVFFKSKLPPKCEHHIETMPTGYIQFHKEANRRYHAGERQSQCPVCQLWLFPDEMNTNENNKKKTA